MENNPSSPASPLPPPPSSWEGYRLDPLACAVADMATAASTYRFSDGHYMAIAALAEKVEFDPNALLPASWAEARVSPLLSVLLYQVPHPASGVKTQWPVTPKGFGELSFPATAKPHPAEWLAAMLLARGADPWKGGEVVVSKGLRAGEKVQWGYPAVNAPIFQALRSAMIGLADRMMQMPGAPSIERIAHDPTEWINLGLRDAAAVHESWLHRAASGERLLPVLEWFLDNGIRPNKDSQFHPLEQACLGALKVFKDRGLLPSDKATHRRLASAWGARAKSGEITVERLTQMTAMLEGRQATAKDELASEFMVLLTRNAWGSFPSATSEKESYAYDTGAKKLVQQAEVASGALAGRWSRLAALLVNRLRQTRPAGSRSMGILRFDLERMLGREDAGKPGPQLSSAIGFEWRPGVAIDGLVALALMGNSARAPSEGLEGRRKEFEHNAALLGVLDPYGWAREHVPSAIAFTSVFMARGSTLAFDALEAAWEHAIFLDHDLLGDDPKTRKNLLSALTGNFSLSDENRTRRASQVAAPWSPPADASRALSTFPGLESLAPAEVSLALEVALATRSRQWLEGVGAAAQYLSGEDMERIGEWVAVIQKSKSQPRPEGMQVLEAIVNEKKMTKALSGVSPGRGAGNKVRL